MACVMKKLGDLCTVMTGTPISRAKKLIDGESGNKVKVLVPKAMENGRIVDTEIAYETVTKVKDDFFTKEGDVIIKASTPYDCVYIDAAHQGLLVTSFGMIIRKKQVSNLEMRYLAMYLNQPQTREMLQNVSVGVTLQLIKKPTVEGLDVPIVEDKLQKQLAALYENVQTRNEQCLKMIAVGEELLGAEFSRIVLNQIIEEGYRNDYWYN